MHAADDRAEDRVSPVQPPEVFRLWITGYDEWRPAAWSDRPPLATALEPASEATYSAADAQVFLQGFNSQMLRDQRRLWVVAVPVTLRFEGDLRPGDQIRGEVCAPPGDDVACRAKELQLDQGFSQSPHRSR